MKAWLKGFYIGIIVGTIFEIISFLLAHLCTVFIGSEPLYRCRIPVIEFYLLENVIPTGSVFWSYIASISIIIFVFGIFGAMYMAYKYRKH
tara:strand:+ start:607 stop:879 length:273 start_codon:yes stop_codon:yes gene_type:complete